VYNLRRDRNQLERQSADIQSKVEELEDVNSSLRERDKVKDDAIANLSDQLIAQEGATTL
jgi:FtsZ-binding cell division protein ZapB